MGYLEEATLRRLLKRYSEFLQFPIELYASKTTYDDEVDEEATKKAREEDPEAAEVTKSVTNVKFDYEVVNSMKPLWLRPPKEVNASEHSEFYKSAFRAFDDPLRTIHFALEGQVQFKALMYVPKSLPFELNQNMFDENAKSKMLGVIQRRLVRKSLDAFADLQKNSTEYDEF